MSVQERARAIAAMRAAAEDPHCGQRFLMRHRLAAIEHHAARLEKQNQEREQCPA